MCEKLSGDEPKIDASVRASASIRATSSPTCSAIRWAVPWSMVTRYSASFASTKETRSADLEPTLTSTTSPAAFTSLWALVPTTASTSTTAGAGSAIHASRSATSSASSDCASRSTTTRRSTRKGGVFSASSTRGATDSPPADVTSFAVKSWRAKEGSRSSNAVATTLCTAS